MPISPARAAAFDILLRVERENAYASELLHAEQYAYLSGPDHGLATELVMGTLRWRSVLDEKIAARSSQKIEKLDLEVLIALRLAVYQLQFLDRVPQHAAVHESVELVKQGRRQSAAPFVNAVLRKLSGGAKPPAADNAAETAHPQWLVERWQKEFGPAAAIAICEYDQRPPQTSIRLHAPDLQEELRREAVELGPGDLLTSARRVAAGDITKTAAFRDGRLSIQDEASQLVPLLLGQGNRILDCCAAPGGKTRILAELNPSSPVVAVELHPNRARLMKKLVAAKNVQIVTGDITSLRIEEKFDRVLADVPCSGTGTLARNPEIKWKLKPEDLKDLQTRQTAILQAAMRQVAPGGRLVYSTCSLEREENTEVVERALEADPSFQLLDCGPELERLRGDLAWRGATPLVSAPYLRTIPGLHPCDGFFAALLEKR